MVFYRLAMKFQNSALKYQLIALSLKYFHDILCDKERGEGLKEELCFDWYLHIVRHPFRYRFFGLFEGRPPSEP